MKATAQVRNPSSPRPKCGRASSHLDHVPGSIAFVPAVRGTGGTESVPVSESSSQNVGTPERRGAGKPCGCPPRCGAGPGLSGPKRFSPAWRHARTFSGARNGLPNQPSPHPATGLPTGKRRAVSYPFPSRHGLSADRKRNDGRESFFRPEPDGITVGHEDLLGSGVCGNHQT